MKSAVDAAFRNRHRGLSNCISMLMYLMEDTLIQSSVLEGEPFNHGEPLGTLVPIADSDSVWSRSSISEPSPIRQIG